MDCEGRVLRYRPVEPPAMVTVTATILSGDLLWEAEISMPRPESDQPDEDWLATCIYMLGESVRMGEQDTEP